MHRRGWLTAAAAALAALAGRGSEAAAGGKKYRAVFDLSAETPERWDGALKNIENLRRALGPENVQVELVVHGNAYPLVQRSNTAMEDRLRGLQEAGVQLSLCENTMKRFEVSRESLFPFVGTVDAAVAELVRRQEAGWAYVKVGG